MAVKAASALVATATQQRHNPNLHSRTFPIMLKRKRYGLSNWGKLFR